MPPPSLSAGDELAALERYQIPNLRNACRIQKLLATRPDGFTVTEIARELKVPYTTTLRIMATLQLEGFVRKVGSRFELGPVVIHIGNASLAGTEIRDLALPVLETLTARTEETSHLAIPCEGRPLIVAVQDSPHPLRAASRPGFLAEPHCSSTGKALLAFHYHDRVDDILGRGPLHRRTPNTMVKPADVKRDLELTRKRGYSLDDEEYHPGVRCLAAPVLSSHGKAVAAIGITAATVRFTKERIPEIAAIVRAAAQELSGHLGHHDGSARVRN
jgi:IclR family acetate operon transcriptional repressor